MYLHPHASISLYVPTGACFPHFVIERRMLMEALRGTESGAGQSAKSDCSVRTVAQSGKCHAVGCREKWRERGRVMERRWSVSFAAHHTLNSEVKVFWLVTVLEPRTIWQRREFNSASINTFIWVMRSVMGKKTKKEKHLCLHEGFLLTRTFKSRWTVNPGGLKC